MPASLRERRVPLLDVVELIRKILTEALCVEIFKAERVDERQRKWTLPTLLYFWVGVVVRNPRSLSLALSEAVAAKGEDKIWPRIQTSPQAFFKRAMGLRPKFFAALFRRFTSGLLAEASAVFCSSLSAVRTHFPEVLVVDGSKLDSIAHRLKILWKDRSVILPGCVTAFYDIFRGIPRLLQFYADAAASEFTRAVELLDQIAPGTLILGDRLYSDPAFFVELERRKLFGLTRAKSNLKIEKIGRISRRKFNGGVLEDWHVNVGAGKSVVPQTLRLIKYRGGNVSIRLLTNVDDPQKLSAETALELYRDRWTIERMYYDLKQVLDLHRFYAANPNGIAMQVYATAMVYAAARVAQAKIASAVKLNPEQISTEKFIPRLAKASAGHAEYLCGVETVVEFNPEKQLRLPGHKDYPKYFVRLGDILRQVRSPKRRKRRFCKSRGKWKSITKVSGGAKFKRG